MGRRRSSGRGKRPSSLPDEVDSLQHDNEPSGPLEAEDELDDFEVDEVVLPGQPAAEVTSTVAAKAWADSDPVRDLVVPESANGERLDLFLTQLTDGYSREQIRKAVQEDAAEVDGKIKRPSFRVRTGQRVRFRVPPPPTDGPIPEAIPLSILFEDDGMVVVNKPPGMVVHPARGNWTGTLTSALAYHFQSLSDIGGPTRPGIVHRLDRDTSGVIVVAKTNAVHIHLAEQWAQRTVEKTYVAIACGPLNHDRDVIDVPIGRHPYQREKMAIREGHITSKPARTFYEVLERYGRFSLVRLNPETGRTHQIRVHLEHRGCPVLCDRLYGGRSILTTEQLARLMGKPWHGGEVETLLDRQALHAARLELDHPQTGKRMVFEAPLPEDMLRVLRTLRQLSGKA